MALALAAAGAACSSKPECTNDRQCGAGRACVKEMCLDRGVRTLAIEITPPTDSTSALTEIPMLTSSDVLDLSVDLKTAVRGTVATPAPEDEGLYTSHEAHVNVTIPS
ncbi:MAG TPA: hypothetical protein VHU40_01920, partial [Polyangia bacterium]|nr:hypothetical protein [Polyangia bacterium]